MVSPPLSGRRDGSPEDCGKEGKCRKGERSWEKWFRHLAQEWSPRGTESERNKQAEERLSGGPCGVWGDHRVGAGQSLLTASNSFRFSPFQAQAGLRFPAPWWLRGATWPPLATSWAEAMGHFWTGRSHSQDSAPPQPPHSDPEFPTGHQKGA